MKIKKSTYIIYIILVLLPLAVTAAVMPYLEKTIPTHYGVNFQADGFGSKTTLFILPAATFIMGALMFGIAKLMSLFETNGNSNERVVMICGLVVVALFNAMTYYFLYAAYIPVYDLSEMPLNIDSFIFFVLGIGLIIIGNIMPKTRKNSLVGLRTKWSMKNDVTWKKSQLFGGICLMLTGIAFVIMSIIGVALYWYLAILLIDVVICVLYSYMVAKKYS
ncbi:MAG: SdpI family protein [Ruminococcus sp.]|nr:SdpI family protein [Ruminococcus sp.]